MNRMWMIVAGVLAVVVLAGLVFGTTMLNEMATLREQVRVLEETLAAEDAGLLPRALSAVSLIAEENFGDLAGMVHPVKGLRFSPYGHVRIGDDLVFSAQEVSGLMNDLTTRTWGAFDGSGEPIVMTFAAYYERFVYEVDFANPHVIGINNIIGQGNTLINIDTAYPNGQFVEFHFSGFDPQFEGMDWRSLRLVFEMHGGQWMLVGVISDQWTI